MSRHGPGGRARPAASSPAPVPSPAPTTPALDRQPRGAARQAWVRRQRTPRTRIGPGHAEAPFETVQTITPLVRAHGGDWRGWLEVRFWAPSCPVGSGLWQADGRRASDPPDSWPLPLLQYRDGAECRSMMPAPWQDLAEVRFRLLTWTPPTAAAMADAGRDPTVLEPFLRSPTAAHRAAALLLLGSAELPRPAAAPRGSAAPTARRRAR